MSKQKKLELFITICSGMTVVVFPERAVEKLIFGIFIYLCKFSSTNGYAILVSLQRNKHQFVRWISCMQMLEWFSSHSHV